MVQKSPAWPVYPGGEHSFVTWNSPLRGKDAETSEATVPDPVAAGLETAGLALGLTGFTDPSAHPTAASAAPQRQVMTTRCVARLMIFSFSSPPAVSNRGCVESVMSDERLNDVKMRI